MKSNKVVLAYSGGLDTSVIAKWLMEHYDLEVVTFTADIGQGEETKDARLKAKKLGIKRISLETGAGKFFEPARKLFKSCGFEECEPFGHYKNDPNSCYMKIKV